MAIQTRYVGDSLPITNVDLGSSYGSTAAGAIIAPGLTKAPIALKISLGGSNTWTSGNVEMNTGGAVETILRNIAIDSTITMYQVDNSTPGQLSVLLEATGAGPANSGYGSQTYTPATIATAIATRLQALGNATVTPGNIGLGGNIWAPSIAVTSSGFKLA
jgi:hypothetical protein